MIPITIYSRPGCHLCDEMKTVVQRVAEALPLVIDEIDVSLDAELERRYGVEIPVLMIDGKKVAKYRVSEGEILRILRDRVKTAKGAG